MRDRIEQSKLRRRFENDSDLQPLVVRSAQGTPRNTTQIVWRRSLVGYSGRFIPGRSLVRIRSPLPYGSLAQLVRAPALQAGGHRFESCSFHHLNTKKSNMALWSSGLRHRPFTAVTRVRTSVGSPRSPDLIKSGFFFPAEVGYFISARFACRTRYTRLTLRFASELARSAITAVVSPPAYEPR